MCQKEDRGIDDSKDDDDETRDSLECCIMSQPPIDWVTWKIFVERQEASGLFGGLYWKLKAKSQEVGIETESKGDCQYFQMIL